MVRVPRRAIAFAASSVFALLVTSILATSNVFAIVVLTTGHPTCSWGGGSLCRQTWVWYVADGVVQWVFVVASVVTLVVGIRKPDLRARLHWVQIGIAVLAVVIFVGWACGAAVADAAMTSDNWE
jgi:hypothetical protein